MAEFDESMYGWARLLNNWLVERLDGLIDRSMADWIARWKDGFLVDS